MAEVMTEDPIIITEAAAAAELVEQDNKDILEMVVMVEQVMLQI